MGASVKTLDFTGVKDQGQFNTRRKPEGDYFAHIVSVEDHTSKDKNHNWLFTISIDGDSRASYPYYCGTDEKALWKVRGLFIAAGVAVPKKRLKIDPNKLVGKAIGVSLEDDEYEGRPKSVVAAAVPIADLDGALNRQGSGKVSKATEADEDDDYDDDEDDTPPPPKKRTKKRAPEPEPEDDDEDEDEEDEEEPPPPAKKKRAKKQPEPEEDDEDEDDEPTPPRRKASKTAPAKKSKKRATDEDDEDDDLDLDDL